MGKINSRAKGHSYEREVARDLREIFGPNVRRGQQSFSGKFEPDVCGTIFWPECKRMKRTNPKKALKQAIADCDQKGRIPIAVCKDNREPATVTMLWVDFLDLVKEWYERGC